MKKLLVLMMIVVLSACSGEKDAVVKSGLNEEYVEDKQDYKYKASDLKTDKVEVVYVTSDAYGEIKNIEVETTLKAKEDGELKDVNVLNNVINTSGDEDHDVKDDTLVFENHGSDITYKGNINKDLPVNVKLTYYLDDKEVMVEELAHKSGHLKIVVDYINNTKVPFLCLTTMILSDRFSNVKVENGKLLSLGDTKMAVLYGEPGLKDSLMLYKVDTFDDIKLNDSAYIEADVEDFTLDYTATIVSNGLFKEIKDDDLNKLSSSLNDLSDLNEKIDDIKDASKKLKDEGNNLKDGVNKLNDSINGLDKGISKYNDNISQIGSMIDGISLLATSLDDLLKDTNVSNLKDNVNMCASILDSIEVNLNLIISIKNDVDSNNENIDKIDVDQINDEETKNAILALKKIDLSGVDLEKLNDIKNNINDIKNDLSSFNILNVDTTTIKEECVGLSSNKELLVGGMNEIANGSSSLKSVINKLNENMPNMTKAISEFSDKMNEAIDDSSDDLNKFSGTDMKNIVNNIKMLKNNDKDYDTFVGKLDGMTSSVSFIIETAEIK